MASTNILFIALPPSIAWFGLLGKFGFDMKRDGRLTQMWGYFFWSVVPFAVVALIWASQRDVDVTGRNIVLGVIGAAIGASGFIWIGYLVRRDERIAEPKPPASTPAQNSIGDISGNSGIITQSQKGDNR
jgi:hypothetical protein